MQNKQNSFIKSLFSEDILNKALFPYPLLDEEQEESVEMKHDTLTSIFDLNTNQPIEKDIELSKKMKLGGLLVSRKYKGFGFNFQMYLKILNYISKYNLSLGATIGIYHSPCLYIIDKYGNEAIKNKYLSNIAGGSICSYALYDNTPDIGKYQVERTTAELIDTNDKSSPDRYYKLSGEKKTINSDYSDIFIVFARTENGLSCFVVDKNSGIELSPDIDDDNKNDKSFISHSVVKFNGLSVPAENLLGKEGDGLSIAIEMMSITRTLMSVISIILTNTLLKRCIPFCVEKDKSDKSYSETSTENQKQEEQQIKNDYKSKLVRIAESVFLTENILHFAAKLIDDDYDFTLEASALKRLYVDMLDKNLKLCKVITEQNEDEELTLIKEIITEFDTDRILLGDSDELSEYVAVEGLKVKQREIEEYKNKVNHTTKQIQTGFKQFGDVASKTFSTLAKSFNILTGKESQMKKTQQILSDWNELKSDIDSFNKTFEKNTKSFFNIGLEGAKNIKEELLEFLPNDLIGMSTIKKVSEAIDKARVTFNLYLNILRQESRMLNKRYSKAQFSSMEEKLYIFELTQDMVALGSSISKTEQLLTQKMSSDDNADNTTKLDDIKKYYVDMLSLYAYELRYRTKFKNMFESSTNKQKLIDNLYEYIKKS
jgi:alkylation response protein AidB-like acyl-CoA dehydrogenase